MSTLLIKNVSVVTEHDILRGASVYCEGGVIKAVGPNLGFPAAEVYDLDGMLLCPGFIDLHIHGAEGLLAESGREQLEELCRRLPKYGVTGFLPAVCPLESAEEDIALLTELSRTQSEGAEILGFFLEGHYLALAGSISHTPRNMEKEQVRRLRSAAAPCQAVFAVSPEIEGIAALLPEMTDSGSPAFITHTGANTAQTQAAIKAGATHATHFYNVFPHPGDKEPGVRGCGAAEAILTDPDVSVDFILDGEHVDAIAVKMALRCKGADKVCLITDSNINAGMPPGVYTGLGGTKIEVTYKGGPARIADGELAGCLAGSGLTMDRAVRNAVHMLELGIPQAVAMASANPAAVLGLKSKGKIAAGYDADFVLLDEDCRVLRTWKGGKAVFVKER